MVPHRIIVVDDDDYSAMLTRAVLHRLGYRSDCFSDPGVALQAVADAPERYQAIVACERIAGVAGVDFLRECARASPRARILLTSGDGAPVDAADPPFDLAISRACLMDNPPRFVAALESLARRRGECRHAA